ncbi:MAG: efflux RND transporter periplasmic adaptor subunit [Steroidobacteraceae bacterium]|nr:efflux RND transporter periplasmic adaptor subunit [Steroidobacteraceae bacterium]
MMFSATGLGRLPLVLAMAAALAACSGHAGDAPSAPPVPDVLTVRPTPAEALQMLRLPAYTQPREVARIHSRATGFVESRLVDIGDLVAAGTVLARISSPEVDEAVREARAQFAKAQADEALARSHHDRARALVESGVVSRQMYDDRKANLDVAAAARAAAGARLAAARERQSFQAISAPFAGRIVTRNVERGDRVTGDAAVGQPLFELQALDPLRVVVDLPQSVALQVRAGMKAAVTFPELPGEILHALVDRTSGSISAGGGSMRAELRLPNPGARIPAGMAGTVTLEVPRTVPALLLPNTVLIRQAGASRVAVVKEGRVEFRNVALGRDLGNRTEVLSGVAAGESVVVSPNALLQPGTKVRARTMDTTAGRSS